jgi:hypothetical protein
LSTAQECCELCRLAAMAAACDHWSFDERGSECWTVGITRQPRPGTESVHPYLYCMLFTFSA